MKNVKLVARHRSHNYGWYFYLEYALYRKSSNRHWGWRSSATNRLFERLYRSVFFYAYHRASSRLRRHWNQRESILVACWRWRLACGRCHLWYALPGKCLDQQLCMHLQCSQRCGSSSDCRGGQQHCPFGVLRFSSVVDQFVVEKGLVCCFVGWRRLGNALVCFHRNAVQAYCPRRNWSIVTEHDGYCRYLPCKSSIRHSVCANTKSLRNRQSERV